MPEEKDEEDKTEEEKEAEKKEAELKDGLDRPEAVYKSVEETFGVKLSSESVSKGFEENTLNLLKSLLAAK